jgi:hypothetical protein
VERLGAILRGYSRGSLDFLARRFPRYASAWHVDYASFRPIEEHGRRLAHTDRNDLMHVDAFPTRPTHGNRILRFFTNISGPPARVDFGGTFDGLAERWAAGSGLLDDAVRRAGARPPRRVCCARLGARRSVPSAYDAFMLGFHDFLKNNAEFQAGPRERDLLSRRVPAGWC